MNIGNSLLNKEDFAWMKKQTLLRLNWVFHCIVLLMNKNKNRQCWMLWKQEYLSIVCKFVTEWKERFKWAIWKIIWNGKQFFVNKMIALVRICIQSKSLVRDVIMKALHQILWVLWLEDIAYIGAAYWYRRRKSMKLPNVLRQSMLVDRSISLC